MATAYRSIERAREELAQLHAAFLELEKHKNSVCESLRNATTELFGQDRQAFTALHEAELAARIAELVVSRLPVRSQFLGGRKRYVREREAADYMGIKVTTLRAWRLRRSKNGPPFTRVGRMVMYPTAALEDHMRAGLVARRS